MVTNLNYQIWQPVRFPWYSKSIVARQKIHELELDLGQTKMAQDGFVRTLEKTLVHTVPEPETDLKKSAWTCQWLCMAD